MSEVICALVESWPKAQLEAWLKEATADLANGVAITQLTEDGQSASGVLLRGSPELMVARLRRAVTAATARDGGDADWDRHCVEPAMGHVMNFGNRAART